MQSPLFAELFERHITGTSRPTKRQAAHIVHVQPLHFDFWRNAVRLELRGRNARPIHGDLVSDRLRVALNTRKAYFVLRSIRQCVYVVTLDPRSRRPGLACLERNDFKRNPEDLSYLLGEFAIVAHLITCTPQTATDNLLAKQLRHERAQADDVGPHGR